MCLMIAYLSLRKGSFLKIHLPCPLLLLIQVVGLGPNRNSSLAIVQDKKLCLQNFGNTSAESREAKKRLLEAVRDRKSVV